MRPAPAIIRRNDDEVKTLADWSRRGKKEHRRVEFSSLSRQALEGASFTSAQQLRQAIDDFVAVYHPKAAPFEWKKAVVFSSGPKAQVL
jgi:hypothetical protein